jgi:hypothetical protein
MSGVDYDAPDFSSPPITPPPAVRLLDEFIARAQIEARLFGNVPFILP